MNVCVIGSGIAAFAASLAARSNGADVTRIGEGPGATGLAGGAFDVVPIREADPATSALRGPTLADRVRAFVRATPHHPYARLCDDVVAELNDALTPTLEALAIYRALDLEGRGLLIATELGLLRIAATAQRALLDLTHAADAVSIAPCATYDAAFLARSLAAHDSRGVRYVVGTEGPLVLDDSALATSLASPQSIRLSRAVSAVDVSARVLRVTPKPAHIDVELDDHTHTFDAVILCTGQRLGGGLTPRGESLAGLPLYESGRLAPPPSSSLGPDPLALYGDDPLRSGPGSARGVGYDRSLRALDADQRVVHERLFVAGGLLDGFDAARDGTGLGCAAFTGYRAGLAACRQ